MQLMQESLNQAEMVESEDIQIIVNQAATKAVTAVMMALRDADMGPQPAATASLRESQRLRHDRPALKKAFIELEFPGQVYRIT